MRCGSQTRSAWVLSTTTSPASVARTRLRAGSWRSCGSSVSRTRALIAAPRRSRSATGAHGASHQQSAGCGGAAARAASSARSASRRRSAASRAGGGAGARESVGMVRRPWECANGGEATVSGRGRAIIRASPDPGPDPAGRRLHPAMSAHGSQLVGRERELAAVARALERLAGGQATFLELAGRAGDRQDAAARRALRRVPSGAGLSGARRARDGVRARRALRSVGRRRSTRTCSALDAARLRRLAGDELDALAVALPVFADVARRAGAAGRALRRAPRAARPARAARRRARGWCVCLDDVHWADPASLDLLAALARRPPERAVLLAVAYREGQAPDALVAALG